MLAVVFTVVIAVSVWLRGRGCTRGGPTTVARRRWVWTLDLGMIACLVSDFYPYCVLLRCLVLSALAGPAALYLGFRLFQHHPGLWITCTLKVPEGGGVVLCFDPPLTARVVARVLVVRFPTLVSSCATRPPPHPPRPYFRSSLHPSVDRV